MPHKYNEQGLVNGIEKLGKELEGTYDWIEEYSFEWDHAWQGLWTATQKVVRNSEGILVQDHVVLCAETNECFQYMGTSKGIKLEELQNRAVNVMPLWMNIITVGKLSEWWYHSFRHRHYPDTESRVYLAIPASPVFVSNKIKGIPMKEHAPLDKNTIPATAPLVEEPSSDYTPF